MSLAGLDAVARRVREHGGVLSVNMGQLRDAVGAGKLGSNVVAEISNGLRERGIRHYPEKLPTYQHEVVRLYEAGSHVGRLVEAVLTPGQEGDDVLRAATSGSGDGIDIYERLKSVIYPRVKEICQLFEEASAS